MDLSEPKEIARSAVVSTVHSVLGRDPSVQGFAVTEGELCVVVEPGASLAPSSVGAIGDAGSTLAVRVVEGLTSKQDLERARRAIDAGTRGLVVPPASKGIGIATDWLGGRVRLTGDVVLGEAIVGRADVDHRLVIVEDGPAIRRVENR